MALRITLDRLYPDMKEATLGRWLKQEGEEVAQGEPIVELITDKVTFELESPGSGTLRRIYIKEKSVVPIGCTLAVLAPSDETLPDIESENQALIAAWEAEVSRQALAEASRPLVRGADASERGAVRATPSARRAAREHGVDLAQVPRPDHGPITERDVLSYVKRRR